jgi:hypothetical protein
MAHLRIIGSIIIRYKDEDREIYRKVETVDIGLRILLATGIRRPDWVVDIIRRWHE